MKLKNIVIAAIVASFADGANAGTPYSQDLSRTKAAVACCNNYQARGSAQVGLNQLVVRSEPFDNRAVAYSNKRSAFFYTQTATNNHQEHAHFRGLTIAGRRIFNDYKVSIDGTALDHVNATSLVTPDKLVWQYSGGMTETLRMLDDRDALLVDISGAQGRVTLRLSGDQLKSSVSSEDIDRYVSLGADGHSDYVAVGRAGQRFIIAVGSTATDADALLTTARQKSYKWLQEREARLASLLNGNHYLLTDDATTTNALRWMTQTTDLLLTHQRGDGIYAGLPWFAEYWGRDTFISFPGATLATGQFAVARNILTSFAKFQDLDPKSSFYGRVPNIVRPSDLDYHTTDGTPRFVLAMRDYVRYSGDKSIVRELYPNVVASIEGAAANWTDDKGYLLHADNETWMDARRQPDLASYSPRATRANDIQALWIEQLLAGAEFATMAGDHASAEKWKTKAAQVRAAFAKDFVSPGMIADHLDAAGKPDLTLRPNLLFALPLVPGEQAQAEVLKTAWQKLVLPWGVATIDPASPYFHPYHRAGSLYPKDAAYHNGTVWPWLAGIAVQRMIEFGQIDRAWPLLRFQNELALERGVVGGLPETMDAYPHPGEVAPRLTGAFLQAWSNAEHLRVWYQFVLGVRPDMARERVTLAPRLPGALGRIAFAERLGSGTLNGLYSRSQEARHYQYTFVGQGATASLDIVPFPVSTIPMAAGDTLDATVRSNLLHVVRRSATGRIMQQFAVRPAAERLAKRLDENRQFDGVTFAKPDPSALERQPADPAGKIAAPHP